MSTTLPVEHIKDEALKRELIENTKIRFDATDAKPSEGDNVVYAKNTAKYINFVYEGLGDYRRHFGSKRIGFTSKENELPTFIVMYSPFGAMICRFTKGLEKESYNALLAEVEPHWDQILRRSNLDCTLRCCHVKPGGVDDEMQDAIEKYLWKLGKHQFTILSYVPKPNDASPIEACVDGSTQQPHFFIRHGEEVELIFRWGTRLSHTPKYTTIQQDNW